MILIELKHYIREREKVTFSDICNRFDIDASTANAMLARLEQQGHIQRLSGNRCSTSQCSTHCQANEDWLQWLEHRYPPLKL